MWNTQSLLAESRRRKKADESTHAVLVNVPVQLINAMKRKGFLSELQAKNKDTGAIAEILIRNTESKLYGRVKATRYS